MDNDKNSTPPPPAHDHGIMKKFLFFLKFLEIRLRFVLILIVTALVVGYWDNIQNYIERWQRNHSSTGAVAGHDHAAGAAGESEFEFFCPMHPFVVRDHKDKCPICGMDLVQRKKGAPMALPEGTLARVQVSPDRIMQAGIAVEPVAYRLLTRTVRTYGNIEPDETRLARIVARFPGRIDKLMVNAVGMVVKKGEPLAQIYSPKFLAATQEYVQALRAEKRAAGAEERQRAALVTASARQRLLLAGFTAQQLDAIQVGDQPSDTVTLAAPLAGTVLEKNALAGESMAEDAVLYTIADLSRVWIQALVIESDVAAIRAGMPAEVTTVSYPGEIFYGTVDFISPTVDVSNRAVKVRVAVDNAAGKLKPGMYVSAVMRSPIGQYGPVGAVKTGDAASTHSEHGATGAAPAVTSAKLPTETQADADRFLATLAPGATYYDCPMDPEVVSDKPGDCPKCGMHLVKKQKPGAAAPAATPAEITSAAPASTAKPAKLPTATKSDAERLVATIPPGGDYYVCPMHLDVVSDKAGQCPKCGMNLVRTKKKAVKFPTLTQEEADNYLPSVPPGGEYYQCAKHPEVTSNKAGNCPIDDTPLEKKKKAADAAGTAGAAPQTMAVAAVKLPTTTPEEAARFVATLAAGAEFYTCSMHPEVVSDKPGDCPKCGMHLEKRTKAVMQEDHAGHTAAGAPAGPDQPSTEEWAEGYSCPMHPDELNPGPGVCTICGCGMKTTHIRVQRVLSLPESAVIDTGTRQVVYLETAPGIYDSRAVTLGPRAGAFYPLLAGLKVGDRIVSRGSFLIDAEARLNPTAVAPVAPADGAPAAGGAPQGHQHGS